MPSPRRRSAPKKTWSTALSLSINAKQQYASLSGLRSCPDQQRARRKAQDEEANDQQICPVEQQPRCEGRRVEAEPVKQRSSKPAAKCHPRHRGEQHGRNAPGRLGG